MLSYRNPPGRMFEVDLFPSHGGHGAAARACEKGNEDVVTNSLVSFRCQCLKKGRHFFRLKKSLALLLRESRDTASGIFPLPSPLDSFVEQCADEFQNSIRRIVARVAAYCVVQVDH